MTADVIAVAVTGTWWRHVPAGGDPAHRTDPPADGRRQRGATVPAIYLASDADTCWAEWYRRLAEDAVAPLDALPRDLWRFAVMLDDVAALDSDERLAAVGLRPGVPSRADWPAYQAVGERLSSDGYAGVLYASAARPGGRALCVFRPGRALPGMRAVPPPDRMSEPPVPPRGLRT
jgi:RES domain-containing protein